MPRLVCALYSSEQHAHDVVQDLLKGGLEPGVVSVVMHVDDVPHEDVEDQGTKQRDRTIRGGLLAGTIGALVGGLIAGPLGLIGAGPAALALFGVGGAYGSIAGALTGRDTEHEQLEALRDRVKNGEVLVAVEVTGVRTAEHLQHELEERGGRDVMVI